MPMWGKRQKSILPSLSAIGLAALTAAIATPALTPEIEPVVQSISVDTKALNLPAQSNLEERKPSEKITASIVEIETEAPSMPAIEISSPKIQTEPQELSAKTPVLSAPAIKPIEADNLAGAPEITDAISGRPTQKAAPARTSNTEKYTKLASIERGIPRSVIPDIQPIKPRPSQPVIQKRSVAGTVEIRFDDERRISQWSKVYDQFRSDSRALTHCVQLSGTCSDPVLADWATKLRPLHSLSKRDQIQQVNNLVNELGYQRDRNNYGQSDYWASPREFLTRRGDCEDYAILKYASLIALGHSEQNMRISVGRITGIGAHAFLLVGEGQNELTLDNRTNNMTLAAQRYDFVPSHSMNTSYRWAHLQPKGRAT